MFPCGRSQFYEDQLCPWRDHFDELRYITREADGLSSPSVSSHWDRRVPETDSDMVKATCVDDDKKFEINLDAKQFNPEDLEVKISNGTLTILGKCEVQRDEHGFTKRQVTRSFRLPNGVAPANLKTSISPDGVLTICAQKEAVAKPKEVKITIERTNN
ncbi:Hsp20/alpha crystallin family protein [Trichuris suis]|nr:Hsp20/alpha crystallin family protein [Trichuris suis]